MSLDRAQFEIARDGDSARWLEVTARCLFAARLLGVLESALDRASSYAMEREQFGRPIGSFQAVQQLLADMKKLAVASRSICYASQAAVAEGRDDAARLTRAAKAYVGLAARNVVEQSIQVHGGIGFTTEVPLHLYLKHALTLVDAWGAAHEQHLVLGKLALDKYQDNDSAS